MATLSCWIWSWHQIHRSHHAEYPARAAPLLACPCALHGWAQVSKRRSPVAPVIAMHVAAVVESACLQRLGSLAEQRPCGCLET